MDIRVSGGDKWRPYLQKYVQTNPPKLAVGVLENAEFSGRFYSENMRGKKIAAVAAAHEFGTNNIPARPVFRLTIMKNKVGWIKEAIKLLKFYKTNYKAVFEVLGMMVSVDLQKTIETSSGLIPLKQKTIEQKMIAGVGNPTKPLMRSGEYQKAISYEIS